MSDSNTTNNPPAPAEPQGEQEIPMPKEMEILWRECEARIKTVREDIEKLLTNSAPGPQPPVANLPETARLKQMVEILSALSTDPFALIKRGVQDPQRDAHDDSAPPTSEPAKPTAPTRSGDTNTVAPAVPSAPGTDAATNVQTEMQQLQNDAQTIGTRLNPLASPTAPGGPFSAQDSPSFNSATSDGPAILRAQAVQASGERMRTALEQNTEFTTSLFDQMLALLDSQNRKLGEVDRKISELNGQLNSLKNP